MLSQQQPIQRKSNKLESLPPDLRKIADQIVADKFPEDKPDTYKTWGGLDMGFDENESYMQLFRREYLGDWKVISSPIKFAGLAVS